jgi:HlyD family secretion protein
LHLLVLLRTTSLGNPLLHCNFGKVKKGQKVLIKLDSYAFEEFGMLEGRIDFISEIPSADNTFFARISLPSGLRTSNNKTLLYKSGMTATAEIITEKKRLIERFIFNLRKLRNE